MEIEEKNYVVLVTKAVEIANIMNMYFKNKVQSIVQSLKSVPLDLSGCRKIMNGKPASLTFNFVTVTKVCKLLKNIKSKTCTSVDQLDNNAVKIAHEFIAGPLHHVIMLSLMQQKFPSVWKITKIVPLHKKNSRLKKENFRPVAILSPLSKVLEKVAYEQLYKYFEKNDLFHESLHGYRQNRSTMTALLTMYDKWSRTASRGMVTGVVLADLSAAFDLVSSDILIKKLKVYGLRDDVVNWIQSYLTDRFQSVWIDHVFSDLIETYSGVPQGSILGPLLFLIYFNDLPTYMNGDIECYADDSTFSSSGLQAEDLSEKLSADSEILNNWMVQNKFKLNATKTHLMFVGTAARIKKLGKPNVTMDGVHLEENAAGSEHLLGILIQGDLKWSSYIDVLSAKLKTRLAALEKLRFVIHKSFKKTLVQGVFNSVLSYCLPLFGGCCKNDLDKLQILQNKAVRIVMNLPPRSNRENMFNEIDWLTIRQLVAYHTLIAVYNIRKSRQPKYLYGLLSRENQYGNIVLGNPKIDLLRNSFVFQGGILWNKLPRDLRNENKTEKFKEDVKLWVRNNIKKFEG